MTELTRRRLATLAGAGTVAGLAGCLDRTQAVLQRDQTSQVALTINTLPADDDARCTEIAQFLAERLRQVGVDATVQLSPPEELLRDVLINHDFDLYVAQHPNYSDPDFLRPVLHSRFSERAGWQNPFGFANPTIDGLLERQREADTGERPGLLSELQRQVARLQPFTVVAFPDVIRAVRYDQLRLGPGAGFDSPLEYLSLSVVDDGDDAAMELRLVRTDARVTENLNPLAVEYRTDGQLVGLLYDSLGRRWSGRVQPWLAEGWEWRDADEGPVATVEIRSDSTWHDGQPLTAEDVAFTYRFLQDTSLGRLDQAVPAPRYHGRSSLVRSVEAIDRDTVRVAFEPCSHAVASRAFTVPVLPRQVWEGLTGPATVAGIEVAPGMTEALVWENPEAVGSGPMQVERQIPRTELALERTDDHFLYADAPDWFDGGPGYDRLVVRIAPSASAAVELVDAAEVDATDTPVGPERVRQIGRADGVSLEVSGTRAFYHVGFNTRRPPLSNYQFRRAVASLLDKDYLVDRTFSGYARPAASPLAPTQYLPPDLSWSERDPVLPFPGSNGSLDEAEARAIFEDAGYSHADDGALLARS